MARCDLKITVRADGLNVVPQTPQGIRFMDEMLTRGLDLITPYARAKRELLEVITQILDHDLSFAVHQL